MRRATYPIAVSRPHAFFFYPRSPCGERRCSFIMPITTQSFLSTLSLRRATVPSLSSLTVLSIFLSTLSLRRATQFQHLWVPLVGFSIHALLAESDPTQYARRSAHTFFYPRSPCGERPLWCWLNNVQIAFSIHALLAESDRSARMSGTPRLVFLSTLSLRRATGGVETQCRYDFFLSTLSLRRATEQYQKIIKRELFLSTLSLRRATPGNCQNSFDAAIFYPRSPCGERRESIQRCIDMMSFLSTLSLRRATVPYHERSGAQCFSIHALLAESDQRRSSTGDDGGNFLSTLSLRRATPAGLADNAPGVFSIHALLAESDGAYRGARQSRPLFYPRSPCGERPTAAASGS